jgi:hypothetical protein
MADGVDTIILHNELAYADQLPVRFREQAAPLDAGAEAALVERNLRLLQACAALEDHGQHDKPDEDSPHAADIMRIDLKINLLLELVGHVVARSQSRPEAVPVRFNAHGIVWQQEPPVPADGSRGLVEIHLREALVAPLTLPGVVTEGSSEGHVNVRFETLHESVADQIEKLVFRRHRRQIAGVRSTRR